MTMEFDETRVTRTMAGIVRAEITNIDLWLTRGARRIDIYNQFISQGMVGSFKGFNTAIQRAREQVREAGAAVGASPLISPTVTIAPSAACPLVSVPKPAPTPEEVTVSPPLSPSGPADAIDVDQFFRRKSIFDR
jgi:hypothetical protein